MIPITSSRERLKMLVTATVNHGKPAAVLIPITKQSVAAWAKIRATLRRSRRAPPLLRLARVRTSTLHQSAIATRTNASSRARPMPSAVMEAVPVAVGIGQDLVGGMPVQLGKLAGNFEVTLLQLGLDLIGAGRLAT